MRSRKENGLREGDYRKKVRVLNITERLSASLHVEGGERMFAEDAGKNIARDILAKRMQKEWSQAQAAEACEMSERAYGEIERGNTNPKLNSLLKICKGLDMTILIAAPIEEGNPC